MTKVSIQILLFDNGMVFLENTVTDLTKKEESANFFPENSILVP